MATRCTMIWTTPKSSVKHSHRFLFTSTSVYGLSDLFRKVVFGNENKSLLPYKMVTPKESKLRPLKLSRNELEVRVKEMATTILPISDNDDWTRNRIDHNLEIKSKILYECEKQFQRQVPSNALKGISTLGDIVSFFHTPPPPPPGLLFPDLRDQSKLPQNLSVKLPSQAKPRERVPFQNYDNPKHSHFPNKKELQKQYQARYKGKGGKK